MSPLPVAASLIATRPERIGNVGAGETDLLVVRLPPNILRNPGDTIRISAGVFLAANANSKTDKVYFGSTVVAGRTAVSNNLPRANQIWIVKRALNSQSGVGINNEHGGGSLISLTDITEDESTPIVVKLTGQGAADNDMISRFLMVEYVPAASVFGF